MSPKTSLARRIAAVGVAAATLVALVGCANDNGTTPGNGGGDGALEVTDIRVGVFPSFNAFGARAAEHIGAFEEEGLNVEFVTVGTPADVIPQLGTQIDFGLSDMTVPLQAIDRGLPLLFAAPAAQGRPLDDDGWGGANIWINENSDITSVKELENATFGIQQVNSQLWMDVRAAVDDAGGDSSKINFVETPGATALPALANGDIDATTTAEPAGTRAKETAGIKHLSGFVSAGGSVSFAFLTTSGFADKNPNTTAAFQRAILKGNAWANANEEERVDVAASYIDAPRELLEAATYPILSEDPMSVEAIEAALERMTRYDVIEGDGPDPAATVFVAE